MTGPATSEETLRREAISIFEDVIDARLEFPDGPSGWVSYQSTDGVPVPRSRRGLYAGRLGMAVYFAAMYDVFGDDVYDRWVRASTDHLFETPPEALLDDVDLGVGSGVGSLVYGLALLSDLADDRRYSDRAATIVRALSREEIVADDQYDVLLGAAGGTLGLLAFYERSGDDAALDAAVQCGEHLLDEREDKWGDYQAWDTSRSKEVRSFSTGMGHGAAGVGYALYRLYGHTGREEFRRVADRTLGFENLLYSGYEGNWKANWYRIQTYSQWWCHGLVGIGAARLGSLQYHDSPVLDRDLHRARDGLDVDVEADDSICHGTFAKVDFLVELGRQLDDGGLERARELTAAAIECRRTEGSYRVAYSDVDGLYNPALFLGAAGIGYTLLRLLDPDGIPSILRIE